MIKSFFSRQKKQAVKVPSQSEAAFQSDTPLASDTGAHVWVSSALSDSTKIASVECNRSADELIEIIEMQGMVTQGGPVPTGNFPTRIWLESDGPEITTPPPFFLCQGLWILSGEVASLMMQHNIDPSALHPVSEGFFGKDNQSKLPGDFFTFIVSHQKRAMVPDETPDKKKFGVAGTRWNLPIKNADGNIAVSTNALEGAATWLDPQLFKAIFFNAKLGDALAQHGFRRAFDLHKARVIQSPAPGE